MIKYVSQAIRAIAQLVEHLVYTRANVFQGNPSYNPITKIVILIDALPPNFGGTIAWQRIRSD